MTDIVERLRNWEVVYDEEYDDPEEGTLYVKAAVEIESLRSEVDTAYKRGLERAAEIAESCASSVSADYNTGCLDAAETIRAEKGKT